MDGKKEGVSVKEIEDFARKYRFEVFFGLLFILGAVFSFFSFFSSAWSILMAAVGGCLSVAFPMKADALMKKAFQFLFKQESTLQLVLAVVGLVIAVFLPVAIFFLMGLFGGRSMYQTAMDSSK